MITLGLDFDNTIVCYDKLFHTLAIEKQLIDEKVPKNKISVRNYLRKTGKDSEFTILQGEVYGKRILEAEPAKEMLKTLKGLSSLDIKIVIVSHKTEKPYKGPEYDLHKSAMNWLESHDFFSPKGLNWKEDSVFFEITKSNKIERIKELRCTHYVDDLPEILKELPSEIKRILYDPGKNHNEKLITINSWKELYTIIEDDNG